MALGSAKTMVVWYNTTNNKSAPAVLQIPQSATSKGLIPMPTQYTSYQCLHCGRDFSVIPSRRTPTYCGLACRREYRQSHFEESFWSRVDKSGDCWIWTGGLASRGYGHTKREGLVQKVHRVSYTLTYGPIPDDMCVCHRCDVRLCVNPDHLFLGTNADNVRDRNHKGRQARGERSRFKLGYAVADDIRKRFAEGGITKTALATLYGVQRKTIQSVIDGERWVKDTP